MKSLALGHLAGTLLSQNAIPDPSATTLFRLLALLTPKLHCLAYPAALNLCDICFAGC